MAKAHNPDHEHAEAYKLVNQTRDMGPWKFDEWQAAQNKLNEAVDEFPELEPDDFRIKPVTETDGGTTADETTADETEPESVEAEPVEETEFDDKDVPGRPIEESSDDAHSALQKQAELKAQHAQNLPSVSDGMQDPLETLPGWMKTEIQHGQDTAVDLNKRGSQVIANRLELVVSAECEISAQETDFEYCRYRATVQTPEGETYNAAGDAHINESNTSKWDLERLAETRAKKRAVKWTTGGGIQAFLEAGDA